MSCVQQLYVGAGAYEGATKMYENLVMDCPLYDKMSKVLVQLAAAYRRLGNYDHAFHNLMYVWCDVGSGWLGSDAVAGIVAPGWLCRCQCACVWCLHKCPWYAPCSARLLSCFVSIGASLQPCFPWQGGRPAGAVDAVPRPARAGGDVRDEGDGAGASRWHRTGSGDQGLVRRLCGRHQRQCVLCWGRSVVRTRTCDDQ